ncbi:hypothetical protein, conserved [Eimeria praecox]|uniref:Uncharacterized protein n=1 Tax=Eimeria praecox TaxID=51316 RepID=U6H105_9EIME|nr:hypothetical protein, conserved [Eimeria praecox]
MDSNISPVGKAGADLNQSSEREQQQDAVHSFSLSASPLYRDTAVVHPPVATPTSEYEEKSLEAATPVSLKPRRTQTPTASSIPVFCSLLALALGSLALSSVCRSARHSSTESRADVRRLASKDNENRDDEAARTSDELANLCEDLGEWAPQDPFSGGQRLSPTVVEEVLSGLLEDWEPSPAVPPGTTQYKRHYLETADEDDEAGPSWKRPKPSNSNFEVPFVTDQHDEGQFAAFGAPFSGAPSFQPAEVAGGADPQQLNTSQQWYTNEGHAPFEGHAPQIPLVNPWETDLQGTASATFPPLPFAQPHEQMQWPSVQTPQAADGMDPFLQPQFYQPQPTSHLQMGSMQNLGGIDPQYYSPYYQSMPPPNPQAPHLMVSNSGGVFSAASLNVYGTQQDGSNGEVDEAFGGSSRDALRGLLLSRLPTSAEQSSSTEEDNENPPKHPYVRLPKVAQQINIRQTFLRGPEPSFRLPPRLSFDLAQLRAICKLPWIGQVEVNRLLGVAGRLAKHGKELMATSPRPYPSEAVETLGRRFLLLDALNAIRKILGNLVQWDDWWKDFTAGIPSDYSRSSPTHRLPLSQELHQFALELSAAVGKYRNDSPPSDEEVIYLKKKLFFGSTCTRYFRRREWDNWREDGLYPS